MPSVFGGDARPPYVKFEERAIEDRTASELAGHTVYRTEDWAVIRQVGAKDSFEKPAADWLASLRQNPTMRPEWVVSFKAQFADYKSGNEATPDGTHVRQWPLASRGQIETLVAAGLRTVEDLANAPEPALMSVGIGARELQMKARAWLTSASEPGKAAAQIVNQQAQIANLIEQVASLTALVRAVQGSQLQNAARVQTAPVDDDFLGAAA